MNIWFLTRSLYPYQKTGGGQIRLGQIKFLENLGYKIKIVMPHYNLNRLNIQDNIIQIPMNYSVRLHSYMERLGINEDYLDKWVENAFDYLKDKVKKEDVVFATSGGELGMIKLGSQLKLKTDCRFIVNFHDPLDYSLVNGLKLDNKFHVSREKQEYKYLKNSDFIVTSSNSYKLSLQTKYPSMKDKMVNNYFGYIEKIQLLNKSVNVSDKLKIAYVGIMGSLQKPEILYEIYKKCDIDNVEIYFVGDYKKYKPLHNIEDENVKFIDYMPHEDFLKFMTQNIDIGFVSLTSDYLGACVPSKIYEYLNLGLPMIGALPDGDGKDIINDNSYGIACKYDDLDGLIKGMKKFSDKEYLVSIKNNIIKNRDSWSMEHRIKEVNDFLKRLVIEN